MNKITSYLVYMVFILSGCAQAQDLNEQIKYQALGRCDGCEAVFEYPDKMFQSTDTLPDFNSHEPKIKLTGTMYKPDGGTPASGVILFIYHTNLEGRYPKKGDEKGLAKKQGYLRGWTKTDASGRYTFYTFMPGSYGSGAAHIHTVVLEPNGRYYFIDDYNFVGDPNLDGEYRHRKRGGSGVVHFNKAGQIWTAERNITLGLNIPDYE